MKSAITRTVCCRGAPAEKNAVARNILCPSLTLVNTVFEYVRDTIESVLMRRKIKEEMSVTVCQTFKQLDGLLCPKMGITEKSQYPHGWFYYGKKIGYNCIDSRSICMKKRMLLK